MRERTDRRAIFNRDARAEHHMRLDRNVLSEFGVGRQTHRFRRDDGYAGFKRRHAQALLQHSFGFGELQLCVDAAHVILRGFDRYGRQTHIAGNGHGIAEIVFAFGICIADAIKDGERLLSIQRHQATIAKSDLAFFVRRIAFLANGGKFISTHQKPPVARRVGWLEAEDRYRRAVGQGTTQFRQSLSPHQRRVAEHHHNVVDVDGR